MPTLTRGAAITGWGKCLPPAVLTNADIATFLDTSDEWITSRTGIRERRVSHVGLDSFSRCSSGQGNVQVLGELVRVLDIVHQHFRPLDSALDVGLVPGSLGRAAAIGAARPLCCHHQLGYYRAVGHQEVPPCDGWQ